MDDTLLARSRRAPPGTLPDASEALVAAKIGRRKLHYLLQDDSVYSRAELARSIDSNCVLTVTKLRGTFRLSTERELPSRCRAPRAASAGP
jgi:hypothetical protein